MATDLRVIKTRKNIYDALMILMAQKSFEEIKVSEICDQAMINRSTFYAHFEDKYELLDSLINDLKNSLITRFKKNDIQEINKQYFIKFISLFLDEVEENKELYHMIINSNKNSVAIDMVLETLRDQAIIKYYEAMRNLKNDIEYRLYFMKLLREKERLRDIERYQINKQFYVLKYDKNTGEVNPNRFQRYYLNNRYGNPYDIKSFNNINYMRPARINKNGMALSNQFISLNQPSDLKKYEIYDKFRDEYKSHIKNILLDTGSSFFDAKLNFKKYDINGKRMSKSSSCSDIYA